MLRSLMKMSHLPAYRVEAKSDHGRPQHRCALDMHQLRANRELFQIALSLNWCMCRKCNEYQLFVDR